MSGIHSPDAVEPVQGQGAVLSRRSSLMITGASLAAALAGYVVLAIASHSLTLGENALFVTFWSALFTTYGILTGVSLETARSVAAAAVAGAEGANYPRVGRIVLVVVVIVLGVGGVSALAWARPVFGAGHEALAAAVILSAMAYAAEGIVLGSLSGLQRWSAYSGVLSWEALCRVALVGIVSLFAAQIGPIAFAAAAASAAWVILLAVSPSVRASIRARIDADMGRFLRRSGTSALATGASAILLVGFPILTSITTEPAVYALSAPLMLAISLTRAPIMVPLTSFQTVIVSHFVRRPAGALRAFVRTFAVLVGVGLVGASLAWLVGPWLMATLFGPDYRLDGWILAAMTFASVGTALLTISGALCQAFSRHGPFLAGWFAALAASIGILMIGAPIETRVVGALVVAPYVGLVVHLTSLWPALRSPAAAAMSVDGSTPKAPQ